MSQFHWPQRLPVLVRPSAKVSVCFLTYSYIIIIIPLNSHLLPLPLLRNCTVISLFYLLIFADVFGYELL